jgi:hypothetical protein
VLVDPRPAARDEPALRGLGVGHRLLRRERLAGDDEERLLRREAGKRRREVVAVDVGDEVERQMRMDDVRERAHRHPRTEVAAADADVDDVAKRRSTGGGSVGTPSHRFGELEHRREDAVHLGAERTGSRRRAQRGVEDGAAFGRVDRAACEHRVALRLEPALVREVDQEAQRRGVEQVLREVAEDLGRVERERREAARVARERLAQVEVAAVRLPVAGERRPRGGAVAARPGGQSGRGGGAVRHDRMMPRAQILYFSTTWLARSSSEGGKARPRARAARALRMNSNRVDSCTGRSAGRSPRRIRTA